MMLLWTELPCQALIIHVNLSAVGRMLPGQHIDQFKDCLAFVIHNTNDSPSCNAKTHVIKNAMSTEALRDTIKHKHG